MYCIYNYPFWLGDMISTFNSTAVTPRHPLGCYTQTFVEGR